MSSYPEACPREDCGWKGNLVPSRVQVGTSEEITAMQRAWFRCPHCGRDWEVQIDGDKLTVAPTGAADPGA